jgi:hypothetical protein
MADDMYDDDAAPPTSEDASIANESNDTPDNNKSDATEDQLALVPMSFFKDNPKPGSREMVEVVEVYEGEVSVKCVYGDKDDEEKDEKDETPAAEDDESSPAEAADAAYE